MMLPAGVTDTASSIGNVNVGGALVQQSRMGLVAA